MLFNSPVFLFLFLPIAVLAFFVIGRYAGKRSAFTFLVIASLFFYAWWNPRYVLLIVGSMVLNFWLGKQQQKAGGGHKLLLWSGVIVNLSVLGYYKYANFFVETLNTISGAQWQVGHILLPLAISFFTFTQVAYLVDSYKGMSTSYTFLDYSFFVLFFPHLIAGPVVRHHEILPQVAASDARFRSHYLSVGLTVFIFGLFKKVVLADSVGVYAGAFFGAVAQGNYPHFSQAWSGALAYTCQLYFDFSSYSDMAVGLGYMFGIRMPLNFNSPYKAASISDFWRRWHMSLSRFLRDYLYIPIGGSRVSPVRRHANLMITMLLGGLWHGAGWTFVLWGGLHGGYLVINHWWSNFTKDRAWAHTRLMTVFYHAITFVAVVVGWVVFRANSLTDAWWVLRGMSGFSGFALPSGLKPWLSALPETRYIFFGGLGVSGVELAWVALLLIIAFVLPNTQEIMRMARPALDAVSSDSRLLWRASPRWALVTGLAGAVALTSLWRVSEFLYFQF
jgi:alginate O-acetyltransferase complex protein AlgI